MGAVNSIILKEIYYCVCGTSFNYAHAKHPFCPCLEEPHGFSTSKSLAEGSTEAG